MGGGTWTGVGCFATRCVGKMPKSMFSLVDRKAQAVEMTCLPTCLERVTVVQLAAICTTSTTIAIIYGKLHSQDETRRTRTAAQASSCFPLPVVSERAFDPPPTSAVVPRRWCLQQEGALDRGLELVGRSCLAKAGHRKSGNFLQRQANERTARTTTAATI